MIALLISRSPHSCRSPLDGSATMHPPPRSRTGQKADADLAEKPRWVFGPVSVVWVESAPPPHKGPARQRPVQISRFRMHGIEGLHIVGHKADELSHNGLHAGRIPSDVSSAQEDAIQAFVV